MKTSAISSHPFLQKTLCLVLLACLIAGCVAIGGGSQSAFAETSELSPADLYEQNVNSTVGITISGETSSRYGYGYTYQASGSGFIITSDGYILTNYHVISGSKTVTVATYDHNTYDAKVIGYDASNDIAVIKIDAENLTPVTLGDSDTLRVGESVYAIGNPLGELTFSLTGGIVSALSRNVQTEAGTSMSLIQTDCAINSGNSGGALFNTRGEVIGITNAKYSSSGMGSEAEIDNIGFAIPINSVKAGAVVQDVTEDAPADKAGLKSHDVIVKVGDTDINDSNDLVQVISKSDPGDVLTFHIYRQGQEITLDVEIGSKTESALKDEEEAEEQTAEPQEQPNQNGIQGWSDNPMEDFFRFYFGY